MLEHAAPLAALEQYLKNASALITLELLPMMLTVKVEQLRLVKQQTVTHSTVQVI